MNVHVNRDICDLHGQCVFIAPEIFSFSPEGDLVHLTEVDNDLAANAISAKAVCPVGAIELAP